MHSTFEFAARTHRSAPEIQHPVQMTEQERNPASELPPATDQAETAANLSLRDETADQEEIGTQDALEQEDATPVVPAVLPNLARSRELALAAATTAIENGGTDLVILDMTGLTSIFDYFVIATGTSHRQLVAMSEEIRLKLEKDLKDRRISLDGQESGKWIVLDFGSVVIHLFDEDTRQFYSLEALWADARNVTEEFGLTQRAG